jgi:hypothetical protein
VAVEELLLSLLIVPALGYAAAAWWVRRTMKKIAERQLGFLRGPETTSRFLVFLALFATPIVFGLVVFIQVSGPTRETPESIAAIRTLGWAYGLAAVLTVLSEASVVVRWKAASFGDMFTRVLILTVIPEIVVVWFLNVANLGLAVLRRDSTDPPLSPASADAISRSFLIMLVGSIGAPLAAFLGNRQTVLNPKTYRTIVLWTVVGIVPAVVCFIVALIQLPRS